MTRASYGPQAKKRGKRLLEALLAYASDEFENCDHLQIQTNWQTENQLVVRTKVRFLEELAATDVYDSKLNKEQIKEALKRFENFLEILEDNRTKTRGAEDWHFTLKLWHSRHEKAANLAQFELEWERRRPEKSKQVAREEASVRQTSFINTAKYQDWGEAVDVSVFYERRASHARAMDCQGALPTLAFSPDSKLLATTDTDYEIHLWQVPNGEQVFTCKGYLDWIWSVTFSPDGQILASSSLDGTIKLWESKEGKCLKTWRADELYEGINITFKYCLRSRMAALVLRS